MEETLAKKKTNTLETVAENEPPQESVVRSVGQEEEHDSEVESNSGSVVEKDAASASGSTSSEELLYLDESVPAPTKSALDAATASSPFGTGRSAKLPPRVPTTTSTAATLPTPMSDVEVVEGVLPSQPSIVRRMQETNKYDVDPKDARNLLPGVLLNSGSLDLDGVLDGMEARVTEKKRQEQEALLHLLRQKELENLYLAQQQQQQQQQQELLFAASGLELLTSALNEQCRVSPPGFAPSQFPPTPQQQQPPSHHHQQQQQQQASQDMARHPLLLQQMLNRPRHGRSVSDPTFAFAGALQSMPPPLASFHHQTPSVDPVTTLPLVDQSDALAFLSRQNLQPQQQQPDWSTPDVTMQPSLGGNALLSLSSPNPVPPEMPNVESSPSQRRRRHGPSKSVDFNVLTKQNKNKNNNSSSKERHTPLSPSTGNKTTTRAEVKKMVEYQASLGRPTYAPWFRDRSSRNSTPREGEALGDRPPTHHRTQSLPHVHTGLTTNVPTATAAAAVTPQSPDKAKDLQQQQQQQATPKTGRVGTGVFFPRMPVPN